MASFVFAIPLNQEESWQFRHWHQNYLAPDSFPLPAAGCLHCPAWIMDKRTKIMSMKSYLWPEFAQALLSSKISKNHIAFVSRVALSHAPTPLHTNVNLLQGQSVDGRFLMNRNSLSWFTGIVFQREVSKWNYINHSDFYVFSLHVLHDILNFTNITSDFWFLMKISRS